MPCLLLFYYSKQVIWPSLNSRGGEIDFIDVISLQKKLQNTAIICAMYYRLCDLASELRVLFLEAFFKILISFLLLQG